MPNITLIDKRSNNFILTFVSYLYTLPCHEIERNMFIYKQVPTVPGFDLNQKSLTKLQLILTT